MFVLNWSSFGSLLDRCETGAGQLEQSPLEDPSSGYIPVPQHCIVKGNTLGAP